MLMSKGVASRIFKLILYLLIFVGIYFSAYFVIHNDVGYNTDIARDFLVYQDAINTHKLPLIGPRTGGIDGLFHGPLWYYINFPAFILGHGNPVAVDYFWVFLTICSIFITYYVSKKVFNEYVGLLSALTLSFVLVESSTSFLNPFGAALISPLFIYFFYRYMQSVRVVYLLLTFFVIGLMIQFEVAFGGPMLILSIIYLLFFLFKKKKFSHLLSIFILIIPLSTYILFDLRHNFLQLRSVLGHVGTPTGNGKEIFSEILQNRWHGLIASIMSVPYAPFWVSLFVFSFFVYIAIKSYKDKKLKTRQFYLLFTYLYFGYWPLSFYLNGDVLGIHIFPFIPIAIIVLASSYIFIRRELFFAVFLLVLFFNVKNDISIINGFSSFSGNNAGSWQFNYKLAEKVFNLAPSEFGYYVFTPDELGYGPKYALMYANKKFSEKTAYPNIKKNTTFVILAPTANEPNNNRSWWVKNRVRINTAPISSINYGNGYSIQKYQVNSKDIVIPSDPNLINGLWFR